MRCAAGHIHGQSAMHASQAGQGSRGGGKLQLCLINFWGGGVQAGRRVQERGTCRQVAGMANAHSSWLGWYGVW